MIAITLIVARLAIATLPLLLLVGWAAWPWKRGVDALRPLSNSRREVRR